MNPAICTNLTREIWIKLESVGVRSAGVLYLFHNILSYYAYYQFPVCAMRSPRRVSTKLWTIVNWTEKQTEERKGDPREQRHNYEMWLWDKSWKGKLFGLFIVPGGGLVVVIECVRWRARIGCIFPSRAGGNGTARPPRTYTQKALFQLRIVARWSERLFEESKEKKGKRKG